MRRNACIGKFQCVDIMCFADDERRSFKNFSVEDISHVNLMVGWKLFAKVTKSLISCSLIVHTEKMSSIKRFQRVGLKGLAASSCFSM